MQLMGAIQCCFIHVLRTARDVVIRPQNVVNPVVITTQIYNVSLRSFILNVNSSVSQNVTVVPPSRMNARLQQMHVEMSFTFHMSKQQLCY
jgi:hypothetical protein